MEKKGSHFRDRTRKKMERTDYQKHLFFLCKIDIFEVREASKLTKFEENLYENGQFLYPIFITFLVDLGVVLGPETASKINENLIDF